MQLTQFQLYRFEIINNVGEELTIYVIASNWPKAFNEIYAKFGDDIDISEVDKLAVENIGMLISDEYSITRQPVVTTVLHGMDKYDGF